MGSGIGCVIVASSSIQAESSVWIKSKAFNNEGEYEAVIYALRVAKDLGVIRV